MNAKLIFISTTVLCTLFPSLALSSDKISTLEQATKKTLEANPTLKSFSPKLAAAKAGIKQASLLPNPVFGIEVEDFGGELKGFRQSESTISIDQPIPLGGKIKARKELANAQLELIEKQNQSELFNLLSQVKINFFELIFSKKLLEIRQEQVQLSKKVLNSVTNRHKAGAVLLLEKTKAKILLKQDLIELKKAEIALRISKQNIVSFWGGRLDEIGNLEKTKLELGNASRYLKEINLDEIPILKTANINKKIATKTQNLAQAQRVPDMAIGLGYRRLEQTDTDAMLARVSIGLPILNRNQGSILASESQTKVANLNSTASNFQVRNEIQNLQATLEVAIQELELLRKTIMPNAKRAYRQAKNSYDKGRSSYLDLTDARRTLFNTKTREQEVLLLANRAMAGIEKFTGSINGEL